MRIIDKTEKLDQRKKILALILISIIVLYFAVGLYIFVDLGSYNNSLERYYWWDSEDCVYTGERKFKDFYSEANWTKLEEKAYEFEFITDNFNICNETWGCSSTIVTMHFENGMVGPYTNYTRYLEQRNDFLTNTTSIYRDFAEVNPIGTLRDSPIWTGTYLTSLAFHYAVACEEGDSSEVNEVLTKMVKPVEGFHLLTHVSGLEGNLARFAIKKTEENKERFIRYFYEVDEEGNKIAEKESNLEPELYQGQGEYEDYWYIDHTSRDQHLGYFLGSGIAYKMLTEIDFPEGTNKELLNDLIDQIAEDSSDVIDCVIGSNWHIITGEAEEGEGRGHNGASFLPRIPWNSGGDIILGVLTLGKLINEEKYGGYYKEAINRLLSASSHFSSVQTGSYYANNLGFDSYFLAWFLQDNEHIKSFLRERFNTDFYQYVQYHRNSYFNLGNFIINELELKDDILKDEKNQYRLDDITDNLNRFADYRLPVRSWHVPRVEDNELLDPKLIQYAEIFGEDSNHILKLLYGTLIEEIGSPELTTKFALGVEELKAGDFIWQKDPFEPDGQFPDDDQALGYSQYSGIDYTLPYWMGRYYGYFKPG